MKANFTLLILSITLSSCSVQTPQNNAYSQALQELRQALLQAEQQPEIDETEFKNILQLSDQQFDDYKNYVINKYGEEGWKGIKRRFTAISLLSEEGKNNAIAKAREQIFGAVSFSEEHSSTENEPLSSGASNLKKELDQAQELLDEGLITKQEYEVQRKKILSNYTN